MEPTVATVVDLFQTVHNNLRETIRGLEREQLNWSPGPDMTSAAVLVIHTLGSELDTLYLVRGLVIDRDRDAEFQSRADSAGELLQAIDRADALLIEHAGMITSEDLQATRTRPNRDPQIGLHWLLNNYGHAREHLGHLQLSMQVYGQQA